MEIVQIEFPTFEELCEIVEAGMLSPKHEQVFYTFKAMIEAVRNHQEQQEVANV